MYDSQGIADVITKELNSKDVSISKFETEIGVGRNFVYNLRKGQSPSAFALAKAANYLKVSTDYLLGNVTTLGGMLLGNRLVKIRTNKNMNIDVLANQLGIPEYKLRDYERNDLMPDDDMIEKMSSVLGVSKEVLLGLADEEEEEFIKEFHTLNNDGQYKVREYMQLLIKVSDYESNSKGKPRLVARSDDYITPQLTPEEEKRIEDAPGDDAF